MSSGLQLRFLGEVDADVRSDVLAFSRWIRRTYTLPSPLLIRVSGDDVFFDDRDGESTERWWQSEHGRERVVVELAIGWIRCEAGGEWTVDARREVLAAVGRGLKSYFQCIDNAPFRADHARRWGDALASAFLEGGAPPTPRSGVNWH